MLTTANSIRSNRAIFLHQDTGSPQHGLMNHISALGPIGRLDFERCAFAGDTIFAIQSDAAPESQQEEEARIGTLAYALRKLGNAADAAEFIRCLNTICEDGDARCRQTTASYYFHEIALRGTGAVLKEMGLLAMHLTGLHAIEEIVGESECLGFPEPYAESDACEDRDDIQTFFAREVRAIKRITEGRRKGAGVLHDEYTEWINDLEAGGASVEELDEAFAHLNAIDQYDEGGAILSMSSHERTVVCGRLDPEFSAEDLPERAQPLAIELRRGYADGRPIDELWEDLHAQIDVLFPVSGRMENGARFYSHANRELQSLTRQVLEAILDDCRHDFHLTALRANGAYRQFHQRIRSARDARVVSDAMKQAFEARQAGAMSLKHFIALKTAAELQRDRLAAMPLSAPAIQLIKEINAASESRLRYLSWALYGNNQPNHPVHALKSQEIHRVWEALNQRKNSLNVNTTVATPRRLNQAK